MATQRHAFAADHERIANLALTAYRELPPKGAKPGLKSNNRLEWTVLAAFVLSYPSDSNQDDEYAVISLATGLKCLPYTALPLNGDVLHDQHAEVLAKRGARQWLLQRLEHEVKSGAAGLVALFEPVEGARRWRLREGVRLHLYVSTLPCGDASNKLLEFQRAAQDQVAGRKDVLSPGELLELELASHEAPTTTSSIGSSSVMRGRALSSQTQSTQTTISGSLRTKPGRPDSPPSICMSCSDKIALWNAPGVGMQGSLLSSLIESIYVHSITICDHPVRHIFPAFPRSSTQDERSNQERREALKAVLDRDCRRALHRARPADDPSIVVGWSTAPFPDGKEAQTEKAWSAFTTDPANTQLDLASQATSFKASHEPESCPNSLLFISDASLQSGRGKTENLASGTKMGASTKRPKSKNQVPGHSEPLKPPARSAVCRLNYFQSFVSAYDSIMGTPTLSKRDVLYRDAKQGAFGGVGTRAYRKRKDELLGSKEDAQQVVATFLQGARDRTAIKGAAQQDQVQDTTPVSEFEKAEHTNELQVFKGWLRTSSAFSRFNLDGGIISQ